MYERITDEDLRRAHAHLPRAALHDGWALGRLRAMTTIPGLYAAGEANFSDHGANRLGASALCRAWPTATSCCPATIGNYLAPLLGTKPVPTDHPAFQAAEQRGPGPLRRLPGRSRAPARWTGSTASWAGSCGTTAGWSAPRQGLEKALSEIPALHEEFRKDLRVPGGPASRQPDPRAGRAGGRLLPAGRAHVPGRARAQRELRRPLPRRVPDRGRRGPARRRALRLRGGVGVDRRARRSRRSHNEPLVFENVHLAKRSYK